MSAVQIAGATAPRRPQKPLVVLPCRAADALSLAVDSRWLKGANVRHLPLRQALLDRLLVELGQPPTNAGRAALRLLGQTGAMPEGWLACADPVWMQAGLDHVVLHLPPAHDLDESRFQAMLQDLQAALLGERELRLEACKAFGYLRGEAPLPVAALPPSAIDRNHPARFMPDFNDPASAAYYALCSEIEMFLFEHPYNRLREEQGSRPLNALWLWGGGRLSGTEPRALPAIYSDDAMLRGFSTYSQAECHAWPGTLSGCLERANAGFIAVPPAMTAETLSAILTEIRSLWRARHMTSVTLLFDDVAIDQDKSWRRIFRAGTRKDLRKVIENQQ